MRFLSRFFRWLFGWKKKEITRQPNWVPVEQVSPFLLALVRAQNEGDEGKEGK
jgi:hypothetical protein